MEHAVAGQTVEPGTGERAARPAGRLDWIAGERLDLLKAFFLGLTLTAIFYEAFPLPLVEPGRLLSIFDNAVSEAIVALAAWALFALVLKALRHRHDRKAFALLGSPHGGEILKAGLASGTDPALDLTALLRRRRSRWAADGMVERRLAAVSRLLAPPAVAGVQRSLLAQSEIDARRLDTAYTAIRVLIWGIPIVGFIGTVLGIGDAIAEFSHFVQGTDPANLAGTQVRAALGGVTGGLAVAFNTTLLALALVLPIMLWGSLLQKWEEDLLLSLDEFCLWELAGHLRVTWDGDAAGTEARLIANSAEAMAQLERAVANFSRQSELTAHQLAGVQPLIKDFTDRLLESPERPRREDPAADPAAAKNPAKAEAEAG
jgi:biopolymer transport protein ExbB/TolQ